MSLKFFTIVRPNGYISIPLNQIVKIEDIEDEPRKCMITVGDGSKIEVGLSRHEVVTNIKKGVYQ